MRDYRYSSGADVRPLTGDDIFGGYTDYFPGVVDQYSDLSNYAPTPMSIALYDDPGANGLWFDSDDLTFGYNVLAQDPANNAVYQMYFNSGADNRAYTSDDTYSGNYFVGKYDASGFLIEFGQYTDLGMDGVTEDDTVSLKFVLVPVYEKQTVDPLIDGIF